MREWASIALCVLEFSVSAAMVENEDAKYSCPRAHRAYENGVEPLLVQDIIHRDRTSGEARKLAGFSKGLGAHGNLRLANDRHWVLVQARRIDRKNQGHATFGRHGLAFTSPPPTAH